MKRLAILAAVTAALSCAQTSETIPFRAILSPANEVPPVTLDATGAATVWLHVVRDASGKVISASVDFNVSYQFPGDVDLTGLHIHRGGPTESGPVVIDSGLREAVPGVRAGVINRQGQVLTTNAAALEAINGVLTNPEAYYVNLHTRANASGAMRGQVQRAYSVVLLGLMSPRNETPPLDTVGAAIGSVTAIVTRQPSGTLTSGQVIFDLNYTGFAAGTSFSGFHIHRGGAGVAGPVTINTGMQGGANAVPVATGGAGNLHYEVEVPMNNANAAETLGGLFVNPGGYYINLHSLEFPSGVVRAQLRRSDSMTFPVNLSTANEVPPITGLDASAPSTFTAHTIRNPDGSVAAGVAIFDINHRFPAADRFTGLHIHNGVAGENGPVTINTGISGSAPVVTDTGFGNIYRSVTVNTEMGIAALNSLVMNPERHYVNLHTQANPGGAVRAQLTAPGTALPTITSVISAVGDSAPRTVAPGGLMIVTGTNLMKVTSDVGISSNGSMLPSSYNGTQVTVGGRPAALLMTLPTHLVVQVPVDAPLGMQPVVVRNSNGAAATPGSITVAASAPALFFDAAGGIFLKNNDFSVVTASNPARAGDIIVAYSTSTGAITGLATGQVAPATEPFFNTAAATVTVGGRDARVYYSIAAPGFAGLTQTAFEIPAGSTAGSLPVVLRIGGTASSAANIVVR